LSFFFFPSFSPFFRREGKKKPEEKSLTKKKPPKTSKKRPQIPDNFLIDHVGGPAAVKALAAEHILRDTLSGAMAPHVKNAVQGSERVTDDIDALAENLEVSKPFSYRVTFDAMPEFKWRGAFKGNKVKVAAAGDEASISAAAEAQFATAVKEKSKLLLVAAARPEQLTLQLGDVAVVDFDVTRTVDGGDEVRVPGAARAATQLDTATAEEALGLEGLVDGMVGMAVGAERAIPLTLPSNWMPEELAGAAVMARVKVRELLVWQLPEKVDDAWAEAAYPGSETVAGLKRRLREAVAADVESKTSAKLQEAITTMLAEAVDAAVPESVLRELGEGAIGFFRRLFFSPRLKRRKNSKNSTTFSLKKNK
jgi:trigger factor